MKGGGHRYRWDVRRVWRCSACSKIRKTDGDVTSLACECNGQQTWMELIDPPHAGFRNTVAQTSVDTLPDPSDSAAAKAESPESQPPA